MPREADATVHASCVLVGRIAVLIRGPSGSGKSRLAAAMIGKAGNGPIQVARLVADDRTHLFAANGRLLAAAPDALRGKIEIRGYGIRDVAFEPLALVGLVVDLSAPDAARMPETAATKADILGVKLSRLPVAADSDALTPLLAAIYDLTHP